MFFGLSDKNSTITRGVLQAFNPLLFISQLLSEESKHCVRKKTLKIVKNGL